MDCRLSFHSSLRAVMGVTLCLLVVAAMPASQTVLGEIDPPSDLVASEQTLALVHFIRSVLAYERMKESERTDMPLHSLLKRQVNLKRGFGIAGLDNVDMITSILDRSRSNSRSRPQMSASVNLNQLRALMAKAG